MRYVTHHFASLETMTRARRWLVQLGFDPDHIETHSDGVPRLAVMVKPEQMDEVQMLINAAERSDPEGWPSFWDVARQTHVYPAHADPAALPVEIHHTHSTEIGWRPADAKSHVHDAAPAAEGGDVGERFA